MPRASEPHSPDTELAARRAIAPEGGAADVLTPDLAQFCRSGISVIVAAGGPGEMPVAGMANGCCILPDGRMRLLLPRSGNEALLTIAQRGGRVSATFSQPITHRSIQVKGRDARLETPTETDRQEAVRQMTGLRNELVEVDYPPAFADAHCFVDPSDLVAIDITLDAAFVQTPGPGAGAELKA
jgi:hypothetical protein